MLIVEIPQSVADSFRSCQIRSNNSHIEQRWECTAVQRYFRRLLPQFLVSAHTAFPAGKFLATLEFDL